MIAAMAVAFEKVHLRMRTFSPIAPMFSNMSTLIIDKLQTANLAFVDFRISQSPRELQMIRETNLNRVSGRA
jgi:hypothetical protein